MSFDYTLSLPAWINCWSTGDCGFVMPSEPPNALSVSKWIQKFSTAYPQFEKVAVNGLYPILEKEIQDITGLLDEGHMINNAATSHSGVSYMIHHLLRPRIMQLQGTYTAAQKKLSEHSTEKARDARLIKKWKKLGLPLSILEKHADCARFLIKSGLAFSIVGFRESCRNPLEHDVKLDPRDDHPMLKMQGCWLRWEIIAKKIEYDSKSDKIKSCDNKAISWNYFHPDGLVPVDRFNYTQAYPIYELSETEYSRVVQQAKQFYQTNAEIEPDLPKDCVLQFFSSPRQQGLPNHLLFENARRNLPVHVGIRLITSDRKVYSFCLQMPFEEQNQVLSNLSSTFLTTAQAHVSMLDYEEFRQHEGRIVTSVPLTSVRSQNVLDLINMLNQQHLRFQFMRQNCTTLAREVLQLSGYDVDTRTYGTTLLYETLPSLRQIPKIGPIIAKIEKIKTRIWLALPQFIKSPIEFLEFSILYIPKKMGTILFNLIAWKIGARKLTKPLPEGIEDELLYDKKKMQTFSTIFPSFTALFKDETSALYHSKYFIDWQLLQKSTFTEEYSGKPRLTITPLSQ